MAKFYRDRNDDDGYEQIGSSVGGTDVREEIMETIDKLLEKERFQKFVEDEIAQCEITFDNEIPFKEGFRVGMGFMLWLHCKGTIKSLMIIGKRKRKPRPVRRILARMLGIGPIDFIDWNDESQKGIK